MGFIFILNWLVLFLLCKSMERDAYLYMKPLFALCDCMTAENKSHAEIESG